MNNHVSRFMSQIDHSEVFMEQTLVLVKPDGVQGMSSFTPFRMTYHTRIILVLTIEIIQSHLERLPLTVQKPGQYTGRELNQVVKE